MKIAIKSNKKLTFDSARGIEGIVTISIRLYQKSEEGRMFFIRTYSCEYKAGEEARTATLPDAERYMSVEEINALAQKVDAKAIINNATFIQDFEKVIRKGLLLQTQSECSKAEAEGRSANFGSAANDWVEAL